MFDEAFHALADGERRQILIALSEHNPVHVSELAEAADGDAPKNEPSATRLRLYHQHLPRLESAGLIEWDRDDREVTRGARFEDVRPILDRLEDHADARLDDQR